MKIRLLCSAVLLAGLMSSNASAALTYDQDLEGLTPSDPAALSADGWLVGANVFDAAGTGFLYNYFAFPAPNVPGGGPAFSGVATGEGGAAQGMNQFNTYNDYNNADHSNASGNRIQATIFRDAGLLDAGDVGETYTFSFDAKQGNIAGATTANAYIKVLKTSDGTFADLAVDNFNTTALGAAWTGGTASLVIDPTWVGETLQFGFTNTASNTEASGVFYDNLNLTSAAVPEPGSLLALVLGGVGIVARRRRRS